MGDDTLEVLASETQFWDGLGRIVEAPYEDFEDIDDALRSFLAFTTGNKSDHLQSEYSIAKCCHSLLQSRLFQANQEYVRRQMLYCFLQEEDVEILHIVAALLLFDGRLNDVAFAMFNAESLFPRLVELIRKEREGEMKFHRLLLELLYEMCQLQRLHRRDIVTVDDDFVLYLLQLTEDLSDDVDDPYHYPIIRVLLVLNEQYMCLANNPTSPTPEEALTNRILKVLSSHGSSYRTFGENIILLLNRESTLSAQLLILKLLYLLFTTPSTYEYFYTNDLHVLVDVIIRNLLDLDPGASGDSPTSDEGDTSGQKALTHTYLRVLCPLLKNTQLAKEDNGYKRDSIRKLLSLLVNRSSAHFAPVDETILRLVIRCKQIDWIQEEGDEQDQEIERKLAEVTPQSANVAQRMLGMSLDEGAVSSLSVVDVSAKTIKGKPAVPAPRRNRRKKPELSALHTNGGSGSSQLEVPSSDNSFTAPNVDGGGRSPFSDENREND